MPVGHRVSPLLLIAALIVGSAALTSGAPASGARASGARATGAARPAQAASTVTPQAASTSAPQAASALVPPAGHTLVWSDEFSTDGAPDARNWVYERGFARNQELQWYQPENARVENGLLVIEGRRERKPNTNFQAGSTDWRRNREFAEYTSASLQTRGLHAWQYGVFEMRGRIVTRAGLWPAFWTLGVSGGWPRNGEIDIMEYYRENLLANVAWQGPGRAAWDDVRVPVSSLGDPDWSSKFHVWRMEWTESTIKLLMDGRLMNEVDLSRTVNEDGTSINPLRQPHYILLNLAIGGTNGGDPSSTSFPSRFEVDYVRVFQKR